MPRSRISGAIGGRGLTCRRGRQQPCQHPSRRLHTVAVEANIEPVHPHAGHSSDRKRYPGGPHTCEHQRTHAGLSSTRQWPPTACTPSLAAALVGAPQQRLASAKSAPIFKPAANRTAVFHSIIFRYSSSFTSSLCSKSTSSC